MNENVRTVNLPKEGEKCPSGKKLIASGWGSAEDGRWSWHRYLWAVKQQCVDFEKCHFRTDPEAKNALLCIKDTENPSNTICHGDSGGNDNV